MVSQWRSSSVLAASAVAAMLLSCGQAHSQTTAPSWPIALVGAAHTNGLYGPGILGEFFTDLSNTNTSISPDGRNVIFRATTNTTSSVNSGAAAIWTWSGSNTNVVKNTDTPLGGVGAYTTSGFNNLLINGAGRIAFRDNTAASAALYSTSGTPGRLLKIGDLAPTIGATVDPTFATMGNVMLMNASGSAMTFATVTGGTPAVITTPGPTQNNTGLWAGTPGALSQLVRQSDQVNSAGNVAIPNVLVGTIDNGGFAYSASGRVLFTGALQGTGVNTTGGTATGTNQGLMTTRNGYVELLARRNSPFPDSSGATFTSGTATDGVAIRTVNTGTAMNMNNAGNVVYSASLNTAAGAVPTTGGTTALFSDTGGTLRTIARNTAPTGGMANLGAGLTWGSIFSTPVINSAGTVAFVNAGMGGIDPLTNVPVTSSANGGVFKMDAAGVFTKVFRAGDAAPAHSAVLGNPALGQAIAGAAPVFSGTPGNLALNASGQMAFVGGLAGVGINATASGNNTGLFGMDTDGTIFLIAQKGMLFNVGPGDDRIVASTGIGGIFSSGNQDGRAASLSDSGDLVFSLQFSDTVGGPVTSSGVFYTHIPAPGAAVLLGMSGLLAARRRRR